MENLKTCSKCKKELLNDAFYKDKRRGGLRTWCKKCTSVYSKSNESKYKVTRKKYREENKNVIKKKAHTYYKKNKQHINLKSQKYRQSEKGKFLSYKNNAKNRNIVFKLTYAEFLTFWQKPCSYCGRLILTVGIDRVDNAEGYVIGNCVSCCSICNKMKLNTDKYVFLDKVSQIYKFLNLNKIVLKND